MATGKETRKSGMQQTKRGVVYSGNSRPSLESAYLFSRVSDLVCVFMRKNVHLI